MFLIFWGGGRGGRGKTAGRSTPKLGAEAKFESASRESSISRQNVKTLLRARAGFQDKR